MFKPTLLKLFILFLLLVTCLTCAFASDPLGIERGKMKAILKQVSSEMEKNFYDPGMKGVDWKAATAEADQKIQNAKSVSEMLTAIHVLVRKLDDSHTAFVPPGRNVKYKFGFNAKPFGDEIRIYTLKRNGAAEKAGLQIGDRILAVNKFKPNRKNFSDMMFYHRVIRNAGTLDLTVQRGSEAPVEMHLEAERKVQPVQLDLDREGDLSDLLLELDDLTEWHYKSFDGGIGYAQIRGFKTEGQDFMSGVIDKSNPSKAIILDFRSNGGGSEDTLKQFAGMFISSEQVMADLIGRKKTEKLIIKPRKPHYVQPLFILIDVGTGSAAEMFARHMQTTKRAVLIGDHTAGAVTRAQMIPQQLGADSIVPYATYVGVGRIVFPDGQELEKVGVTPDTVCIPKGEDVAGENDVCLEMAVQMARKALGLKEQPELRVKAMVDRD